MRAILCMLLIAWTLPARADDCWAFDNLMVKRKSLTSTVATWQGHPPPMSLACPVFTELARDTERTISDITRLRAQCGTPTYMLSTLTRELFLLLKAEERTCRLARSDQVATTP